jgi:CRP-like cAMP-binding protein
MDIKLNPNAVNQFLKNTVIFSEGEPVYYIAMVIKGRILISNEGSRIVVGSGTFLGINDLYTGRFQSTYTAVDDLMLYAFPMNNKEAMETVLAVNKDYHGFMVASFYKMINELEQIYQGILRNGAELYQFLDNTYRKYEEQSNRLGIKAKVSERLSGLTPLESDLELIRDRVNYYVECNKLPLDIVKQFYSYGNAVTLYQVEDQVSVVNQQLEHLRELSRDYLAMAQCLVDDKDNSLFQLFAELSIEGSSYAGSSDDLLDIMDSIIEEVNKAERFTERMLGKVLPVNRKKMEEIYHLLLTGDKSQDISAETLLKHSMDDTNNALKEMENSFHNILEYAEIAENQAEEMKKAMLDFVHLKDKTASDDSARHIRRRLAENHYEIYNRVFIRAYKEKKAPRVIDLFLKYGYADERLLTKEQLLSLYFLTEEEQQQGLCKIYDIKSWLTAIYEGKKEPSKNEFDLEYPEMINGLKKQGKLTEKEVPLWLEDPVKKVEYEIQNMFRYNNRTTSGQITTFVPVLHKDSWMNTIERSILSASAINEALANIMQIDYSVFDREIIYADKDKNIQKEYIIKRVFPDIVLLPNVGSNGVMWQEITGKRRDTAGRFLLPIFSEAKLSTLLIRICGRYRWELCRTIEGALWNDITNKSLTSEYSDYLQFYRKNKELNDERKEKIKAQIQRGRSSSREIFVMDYEQWISFEAMGAMKLNKPVRDIMATYCPFSKEIREKLKRQPAFEEAMQRFHREKQKKVRELEGRYRLLQKDNIELTKELVDTLSYHKDM